MPPRGPWPSGLSQILGEGATCPGGSAARPFSAIAWAVLAAHDPRDLQPGAGCARDPEHPLRGGDRGLLARGRFAQVRSVAAAAVGSRRLRCASSLLRADRGRGRFQRIMSRSCGSAWGSSGARRDRQRPSPLDISDIQTRVDLRARWAESRVASSACPGAKPPPIDPAPVLDATGLSLSPHARRSRSWNRAAERAVLTASGVRVGNGCRLQRVAYSAARKRRHRDHETGLLGRKHDFSPIQQLRFTQLGDLGRERSELRVVERSVLHPLAKLAAPRNALQEPRESCSANLSRARAVTASGPASPSGHSQSSAAPPRRSCRGRGPLRCRGTDRGTPSR